MQLYHYILNNLCQYLGNLYYFFNNPFSWKDCPVECVALFCARLQAFMSTYVLGGENILGIVEHHVT
jgi:hypothetical protein